MPDYITDETGFPADYPRLVAAAETLAALADPGRDLLNYATDFAEIASTLWFLGKGLASVYERAADVGIERPAYADDLTAEARQQAARTAKKALVDLARLIGELELAGAA